MDQNLDLQIAALIFLGGTQSLVSGDDHGGVETMSEDGEVEAEPGNTATPFATVFPFGIIHTNTTPESSLFYVPTVNP